MLCNIEWNYLKFGEWEAYSAHVLRPSLLQSFAYAQAYNKVHKSNSHIVLFKINNEPAGLLQYFEQKTVGGLYKTIAIDGGPLWFDGFDTLYNNISFIADFRRRYPARPFRKVRILPNMKDDRDLHRAFDDYGFQLYTTPYQTIWVDLKKSQDQLRQDMRKNFRNMISKAERADITIEWDISGRTLPWLTKRHELDAKNKGYKALSRIFISSLFESFSDQENFVIGRAFMENKPVAAMLLLCHGKSATYQIAWSSKTGRREGAQNYLLWNGFAVLKNKGILNLDLGGVNDETAKGVKDFKLGIGGTLVKTAGLYRDRSMLCRIFKSFSFKRKREYKKC